MNTTKGSDNFLIIADELYATADLVVCANPFNLSSRISALRIATINYNNARVLNIIQKEEQPEEAPNETNQS